MTFSLARPLCIAIFLTFAAKGACADDTYAPSAAQNVQSYTTQSEEEFSPDGLPKTVVGAPPTAISAIDLTTSPDDLFVRIRNGFGMPNLTGDLVLSQQQLYMNRPDYLRRMVERSSRYLHFIVQELELRGMPTELAFLPMVESAYNPMAYSRARAAGLWQFIPSTGRNYNLKQDWWVDERRDIVAATSAALDYLQVTYEMHGDWFLALASYNWGEGSVARAIKKNAARGLPTDYQSLQMPAETRNYVPKLQALKNIFSNPQLIASLGLPSVPNRAYFATVTPSGNIDVKVAAQLAEMPVEDFIALNPAHNRPVIKSSTPLVIPAEKVETFQANLANLRIDDKPLSNWQTYNLRPGEKLDTVAPRFGITLADLKRVNGLNRHFRNLPSTLLVPTTDNEGSAPAAHDAPEVVTPPEPIKAPVIAKEKESERKQVQERVKEREVTPRRYVVAKKGDTLMSIARRADVSVSELKQLNHLKGVQASHIMVGTRIELPTLEQGSPREIADLRRTKGKSAATSESKWKRATPTRLAATVDKAAKNQSTGKQTKITRYTVKRGDTIHSIARQFKVDTKDILMSNRNLAKGLQPGQQISIALSGVH